MTYKEHLKTNDPEIYQAVCDEEEREELTIELIASENAVSPAVLEAQGSVLTNKYAEGYPEKRYYGGCEYVDVAEQLAIDRAKELFQAEYVNVQPHSGSQANMGVYLSVLKPGDKIMGMDLSNGGHLTHGAKVNFSGKIFESVLYGVDEKDGCINYDAVAEMAAQENPKMIVAGASAYSRIIDFKRFREIADSVGAYLFVDMAHIAGLVATGNHPSPIPHAHFVTTTTHKTLRGPRGGMILSTEEFAKDLNKTIFPGIQGGPLMHVIAAKAVAFKEAMTAEFKQYQNQIVKNAVNLAGSLQEKGFKIVSGGTDNHLMLIDLTDKNMSGKKAERLLNSIRVTVNKNTVPGETRSPFVTSGIRIGTPTVTTRGMKEPEMKEIAEIIAKVIANPENEAVLAEMKDKAESLCRKFPLYQ